MSEAPVKQKARKPQVLKGFRDYQPRQMILRRRIIDTFRDIFERHGFEPLDTPAMEYIEVLLGKAGENEKLMYRFFDQGEREVGLRYDLTVPLARYVAMHQGEMVLPFKRYHIAPVWRAEKPQRGRFREFWQCDADIVGSSSMIADAEAVSIAAEALTAVGLPNFIINISHRRLLEGIAVISGVDPEQAGTVYRSVDKLAKIGANGVLAELIGSGIDETSGRAVIDAVTQTGTPEELLASLRPRMAAYEPGLTAIEDLAQLFTVLPGLGVPAKAYQLDLSLARGLDYYTGPVYEATVTEPNVGSVAGAGRYDGLIGNFLGRDIPATGMSLGLERIIEVVEEFSLLPTPPTVAQVIVPVFPDTLVDAARLANELRDGGLRVDFSLLQNRSVGDQLKYAGRDIPATGMSLGLERIIEVVEEFSLLPTPSTVAQVIVPVFPDTLVDAARLAQELRNGGLRVDFSLLQNRSVGDQLKYAGRRGIPFAAIAGENELERNVVAVKNLVTGEQVEVERGAVVGDLAARLAESGND